MKKTFVVLGLLATLAGAAFAQQGPVPTGVPQLNHVFVIMLENHGYGQIVNNPNAPFINSYASSHNMATNYFAVGHPSLTNYLEAVGASNFGVQSDNNSDWHNGTCATNLSTGIPNTDHPSSSAICPIGGSGTDAAIPVIDFTDETQGPPGLINIDGVLSYAANPNTVGMTIADELAAVGKTWKSYQESLPIAGADNVAYSDGNFTDLTDFTQINPQLNPPLSQANVVHLYASKHNPFVYFQSVQQGANPRNSLNQVVDFNALYADLAAGRAPNYSFIAPNQCNDQHGRGNGTAFCNYDPGSDGTQATLNPALTILADQATQRLVTAIHRSPLWNVGHNAIVLLYDENDYSFAPNTNHVLTVVDTNYGHRATKSSTFYTHFSLVKSLEAGFGLPCLNHACDESTSVMSDLFAAH